MADTPRRVKSGPSNPAASPDEADLDPITRNLRRLYADVAAEPIPDELLRLLKQLDDKAAGRK